MHSVSGGFFITGTGTDVGKTVVTAALARFLKQSGQNVLPVKPVQSGGIRNAQGKLDSPDGEVYAAAGAEWNPEIQCPYIFEPPCSPHLAAKLDGVELEVEAVAEKVRVLESEGLLLVEGAGGIMVPLNGDATMLDLMRELDYPVILVSENKLGTINETLLSVMALLDAGLEISGIIMTAPGGPEPAEFGMAEDNIRSIEHFSGIRVLASIPHISGWDYKDENCWAELDKSLAGLELD
ncbi:dethiobiotin synthase [Maridesulfovibrio sp. FT414]|uniref:dethiobiotin synthase n=1 Tax=Maridesulfovibrio sp. FT414 TaxID=2979469 RepID=UPI003D8063E0